MWFIHDINAFTDLLFRDRHNMLPILPIMPCSDSHNHHLLCSKLWHIHNTCTVLNYCCIECGGQKLGDTMEPELEVMRNTSHSDHDNFRKSS